MSQCHCCRDPLLLHAIHNVSVWVTEIQVKVSARCRNTRLYYTKVTLAMRHLLYEGGDSKNKCVYVSVTMSSVKGKRFDFMHCVQQWLIAARHSTPEYLSKKKKPVFWGECARHRSNTPHISRSASIALEKEQAAVFVRCRADAHCGTCGIYSDSYCVTLTMQPSCFLFASDSRNQNICLSVVQAVWWAVDTWGDEPGSQNKKLIKKNFSHIWMSSSILIFSVRGFR